MGTARLERPCNKRLRISLLARRYNHRVRAACITRVRKNLPKACRKKCLIGLACARITMKAPNLTCVSPNVAQLSGIDFEIFSRVRHPRSSFAGMLLLESRINPLSTALDSPRSFSDIGQAWGSGIDGPCRYGRYSEPLNTSEAQLFPQWWCQGVRPYRLGQKSAPAC